MNLSVLASIVIIQIVTFQLVSVGFTRSLFAAILGDPPEPLSRQAAAYLRKATHFRYALGGLLGLVALASLFLVPLDERARKVVVAGASVISGAAFAVASARDRCVVRRLRAALPDAGVKRASLEPRSVRQWYSPVWEGLPFAIVIATIALALWLSNKLGHIPTEMWVLPVVQGMFAVGALLYTHRHGAAVPNVSARLAMFRNHPEAALRFGERLAAREMLYFMFAKIGVTLLLGVTTLRVGLNALEHQAAHLVGLLSWTIVGLLLVMFAVYVLELVRLTKSAQGKVQGQEPNEST